MKKECEHYTPGDVMGKEKPICKYYQTYMNGVCTHQQELMRKFWVERWLREHPIGERASNE